MQRERRGDPLLARALQAEQALEREIEYRRKVEKERDGWWAMCRTLENSKTHAGKEAKAVVQQRADKVGPIKSKAEQ